MKLEGTLIIAQDRWTLSSEFNQRFYFGNNSTTYYQGYGGDTTNAHEWRNGDGTAILNINNNGNFFCAGVLTAKFVTVANTIVIYWEFNLKTRYQEKII